MQAAYGLVMLARIRHVFGALALGLAALGAHAGGGPLGIDSVLKYNQSGIWSRSNQQALMYGVIIFEVAGAVWLGNDDEFGHTLWQTIDASVASAVASQVLKETTGRPRPRSGEGPDAWFKGSGNNSFPSGEVALQASFVTPIIINYAARNPWVWALEILPLYDGYARMKGQAHWQTDVLTGWALGTATGYLATQYETPFFVRILPHGLTVGYSKKF
jgi:undecaprenyl-diphosphatase